MAKLIQDIIGIIESASVVAPFDEAKPILEADNYRIISLEETARLRMQEGKDSYFSRGGTSTREAVLYLPNKRILLTKNSPIMDNPKEATECNRNNRDFYLTSEQVEKSTSDSIEIKDKKVPTNRFGENELTIYAFGEVAKQYGEFLKDAGIEEMPVKLDLTNIPTKPFVRPLYIRSVKIGRPLIGYDMSGFLTLHYPCPMSLS